MRIKIHGGTPGGEVLCRTCSNALITNRDMSSERIVCTATNPYGLKVTEPVYVCSDWGRRDAVGLKQMEDAAWIISTSRPRRLGFSQDAPPLEVVIRAPKEKGKEDE